MTALGAMTIGAEHTDPRNREFEFLLLEREQGADRSRWHVYECRNQRCGCGCRRYVPA